MRLSSCSRPFTPLRATAVARIATPITAETLITGVSCRNASSRSPLFSVKGRLDRSPLASNQAVITAAINKSDIFQLASRELPPEVSSIFSISSGPASCDVSPALINKFGMRTLMGRRCSSFCSFTTHQTQAYRLRKFKHRL